MNIQNSESLPTSHATQNIYALCIYTHTHARTRTHTRPHTWKMNDTYTNEPAPESILYNTCHAKYMRIVYIHTLTRTHTYTHTHTHKWKIIRIQMYQLPKQHHTTHATHNIYALYIYITHTHTHKHTHTHTHTHTHKHTHTYTQIHTHTHTHT